MTISTGEAARSALAAAEAVQATTNAAGDHAARQAAQAAVDAAWDALEAAYADPDVQEAQRAMDELHGPGWSR